LGVEVDTKIYGVQHNISLVMVFRE